MDKLYFRVAACGVALGLGLSTSAHAQLRAAPYFQDDATAARSALSAALLHSRPLTLNAAGLQAALATAPPEARPGAAPLTLALPLPDGSTGRFAVTETAVMAPALAAQFPQIKTYRGVGLDDPTATVRLDLTPQGFHAQILSETTGTVYIDPAARGDRQHVLSFYRRDMNRAAAGPVPACGFQPSAAEQAETRRLAATAGSAQRTLIATGPTLRTYRLAVAATGEYTAFQGGTVALAQAAIVTTINRVVGVYERELAVRLVLVANNSSLIYTSTGSDPYTNGNDVAMISENQTNVDAIIGSNNYDIGHVFGTNSGGRAGLRVVCVAGNKARGITGSGAPVGDAFDIDYVAHEMGHQFGGNHTFNSVANGCSGNRTGSRAYEPGSGSTIMSYAGLCSPDNLQNNSDAYFHTANFEEMATFIASTGCSASTATGNTAPVVTVPATRTLPIGTPFRLTATATDAEGDALTYNWEEMDLGAAGSLADPQVANDNEPLFRSFTATSSPTRYFPRLTTVISNTSSLFERLPTVTRTLTFRCTARDQHNGSAGVVGGVNYSATLALPVTSAAGPFLVTAPNTAVTWAGNSTQTVTWNVAGTTANGVNCATVNILFSTDGGLTYPTTLASGVANDGSQAITVPNTNTTTARIMVAAADNYFFDISNTNFTINSVAACDAPTNLAVASLTGSSASISFAPSGTASTYTVTTTPASTSQTVTASPVTLTGLTAATNYTVNIVSNCAGGVTSAPATLNFATRVANDECATAIGLTSGTACTTTSGTVTGATQSQAASTCDNSLSNSALDVWYSFVATGPTHTVTTNSIFDGVLQVYAGGCGSLTSLSCRDVNSAGGESLTLNGLTNGARYYVRYYPYVTASIPVPADGSFTICVSGPAAPTVAPVVLTPANGSLTNNNRPRYTGTAPAGSFVTIYIDGSSIGSILADGGSNWLVTQSVPLADGTHTVYTTAAVGLNVSTNSNTNTFTVDTTPPQAPVVAAPLNGRRINLNRPFYGGTAEIGATLTVLVDGSSVGTTTVASDGTWGLTQPTALADGSHTVKARATDGAGNMSPDSNTNTFIVDTATPTVTDFASTTGTSGSTVNSTPFVFTVTFSENVTGFTASDVVVTNGTLINSNFSPITNSQYIFTVTPTTPGTVTTVQIPAGAAQDAAGNTSTASAVYSLTYVAPVTATAWTGSLSTDWYTAGNWSAGVPTTSLNASIPANTPFAPLIGTDTAQTLSLSISSGATLNMSGGNLDVRGDLINDGTFLPTGGTVIVGIGSGTTIFGSSRIRFWNLTASGNGVRLATPAGASVRRLLILNDDVITDDNGFVLESDATGTALVVDNGGTIFDLVTVQRYISPDLNAGPGYRHVASPVDGATVGGLTTGSFTPVLNPAYNTSATPSLVTPFPNVFRYDQSRLSSTTNNLGAFDKGWMSLSATTDNLQLGRGYTVNVAASQTLSFTGRFISGVLLQSFSRNNDATTPDAGWQLVGNPFASPLDYSRVAPTDRAGLDGAIYVYESTSQYGGSYRSYVNGFGGNPVLPLGQAFFVRVSSPQTRGSLVLRNSYRVTSYQDPVYHRPSTDTRPVVRLALKPVGGVLSDDVYVYFEQGATDGFDSQYDAEKLPNPSGLNLSTSLSATQRLSIDGRGLLGTAQKVVPLAVGVPATGTYTLTAAELLNLSTVPTYLRDLQTGALIDLAQQPSYQFTVSNASALITGRFELIFSPQRPMAAAAAAQALQLNVWPNPARGQAELNLTLSKAVPAATATLRDVVGRTVATRSFSGAATSLPTRGLATGTYLLSVTAPGQATVTRRVVVE